MRIGDPLPELVATEWLNDISIDAIGSGDFKAILVHFWAMSCPSCHNNMPGVQEINRIFRPKGLLTVAVHSPRNDNDTDIQRVKKVAGELQIVEPCAVDNNHQITDLFSIKGWPSYYLFSNQNQLKRHAMGNFGVRVITAHLQTIFNEEG